LEPDDGVAQVTDLIRLDANAILQQIQGLLLEYPDLADDEVLRADMVEGSTELVEFLRRLERARQEAEANAEALAINIKNLQARKYRFERREEASRLLALKLLFAAKAEKPVTFPEATYSIRKVPPKVIITDEDMLPDAACKFKREPDKTAIKQMLDIGEVPGATLSNGGRTLAIRVG
jgi:hypothetical protein